MVTPDGIDAIWLMGGNAARLLFGLADANAELQSSFRAALPGVQPEDGSGHRTACVSTWWIRLAGPPPWPPRGPRWPPAHPAARTTCPTTAPDHPWGHQLLLELFVNGPSTTSRPSLLPGWRRAGASRPTGATLTPPWPDGCSSTRLRPGEAARTLASIASQCDGIR
jgi:hypothetical protein